jgi:hypothetical protein
MDACPNVALALSCVVVLGSEFDPDRISLFSKMADTAKLKAAAAAKLLVAELGRFLSQLVVALLACEDRSVRQLRSQRCAANGGWLSEHAPRIHGFGTGVVMGTLKQTPAPIELTMLRAAAGKHAITLIDGQRLDVSETISAFVPSSQNRRRAVQTGLSRAGTCCTQLVRMAR